jgi:hypothetical protein
LDKVIIKIFVKKTSSQHLVCHMGVLKYFTINQKDNLIRKMMFIHGESYFFNLFLKKFLILLQWKKQKKYLNKKHISNICILFHNSNVNMVLGN